MASQPDKIIVGWREWLTLPDLGLPAIKAKVDTGARTSAIHAFKLEPFQTNGTPSIRFWVHPWQKRDDIEMMCEAAIIDERTVTDSGGHREQRYVIRTPVRLGEAAWPIEITLTNRDTMLFRMLLGRTAMRQRILVNPGVSFRLGKPAVNPYTGEPAQFTRNREEKEDQA